MEEKNIITESRRLPNIGAKILRDLKRISAPKDDFLFCTFECHELEAIIKYNVENLFPLSEIKNNNSLEKIRLLLCVGKIIKNNKDYIFSISPENLYFDYNFNPKIKTRDACDDGIASNEEDMIRQYKCLIACVFTGNFKEEDFNNGLNLLKRCTNGKKYAACSSIDEITEQLLEEHKEEEIQMKENYVEIKRRDSNFKKIKLVLSIITAVVLAGYFVYTTFFIIPFEQKSIAAKGYFVDNDYIEVVNSYQKALDFKMTKEDKYNLAYSYIKVSAFPDSEKEEILKYVTLNSDEDILTYWSYIAKENYKSAVKEAEKIGDSEFLCYALLKKQEEDELSEEEAAELNEVKSKFGAEGPFLINQN